VTGLDLVRLQIEIAAGARLPFEQEQVAMRGAAMECRIYAEDPANNFFPSPGRITQLAEPAGPGVRVDSGIYPGWTVPPDYDPMLSKLIVWSENRERAIERMLRALGEYYVGGIRTNIPLFQTILNDAGFCAGAIHTNYLDEMLRRGISFAPQPCPELAAIAAAIAKETASNQRQPKQTNEVSANGSRWLDLGREELLR
jgi:acetyl-CoA carboxylase biotin carboxylase subunit